MPLQTNGSLFRLPSSLHHWISSPHGWTAWLGEGILRTWPPHLNFVLTPSTEPQLCPLQNGTEKNTYWIPHRGESHNVSGKLKQSNRTGRSNSGHPKGGALQLVDFPNPPWSAKTPRLPSPTYQEPSQISRFLDLSVDCDEVP